MQVYNSLHDISDHWLNFLGLSKMRCKNGVWVKFCENKGGDNSDLISAGARNRLG